MKVVNFALPSKELGVHSLIFSYNFICKDCNWKTFLVGLTCRYDGLNNKLSDFLVKMRIKFTSHTAVPSGYENRLTPQVLG